MGIIEAAKLVFEYAKYSEEGSVESVVRAIDGVDLDVFPGQFIAILGHNGSGKSTLAKQMNAILTPTEGTLYVDGKDTKKEENIWPIRQTAVTTPSFVILSFQICINVSPGVRNKLKITVIKSRITIDFRPLIINLNGTFEILITAASTKVASTYPTHERNTNRDIMKTIVPTNFTLGSNLWMTESVG